MLPLLYRALTRPLPPLVRPYLERRRRRGKEDGSRLRERRGFAGAARPPGPLAWIHAASVGEATAMLRLIERLLHTRPGLEILVTTGTVASARLLEQRLPARARHQYVPVDLPGWVGRFLDHWRPDLALWVESELWPNLVLATHARGVPMMLVNGRLSARSYARWRRWPGLIGPVLGAFALCLAQDGEQAVRLRRLGAREVAAIGDLKAAGAALPVDPEQLRRLRRQIGSRPVWLAASTHAGEEEIAAAAHRRLAADHPGLLTIIAPRHPVRGDRVAAMLGEAGLRVARRSRGEPVTGASEIYLADTMGELGLFYSLAGIAFVGGSLARKGGHNPFEAARLDCAVLHGPDMSNCSGMAASLAAAGAAQTVTGADDLARAVAALLADPRQRAARCAAGACAAEAGEGIARRRPRPAGAVARPDRAGDERRDRFEREPGRDAPFAARVMRAAPDFWGDEPGLAAGLLQPIGAMWDAAGRVRRALAHPYRAPVPVICVGNLVAGGSGKTPVALALGHWLAARGVTAHFVTRGYGGRLAGPIRVDRARHDAGAVGDEALLLAAAFPSWVARDRGAGVAAAAAAGARTVLLDDGFQNPSVAKSLSLIVVDAGYGFGNGRVMPAGPLRESLRHGLARADGVVLLGVTGEPARAAPIEIAGGLPVVPAVLAPIAGERFAGSRLLAFAGIGRPEKFFATLRALGAALVDVRTFPDHHPFRAGELAQLRQAADRARARLVTTAKDIVRISPAGRAGIEVLEVEIRWPDPEALAGLVGPVVLSARGNGRDPDQHRR